MKNDAAFADANYPAELDAAKISRVIDVAPSTVGRMLAKVRGLAGSDKRQLRIAQLERDHAA